MKKVKKSLGTGARVGIAISAVVVLFALMFISSYNSLVGVDEEVNEAWANVQSSYQRRADLLPNLVETVKAYSEYEGEVLTEITQARASVGAAKNPEQLQAAGTQMDSALSRLLVVVENYPTLKANENYLSLQDELAGTENRIKVSRDRFNEAVKKLNTKVRRFPSNIVANIADIEKRDSFTADEGTDKAPEVTF